MQVPSKHSDVNHRMQTAPLLSTPRLNLRPHRREDFQACCAMWSDPIVTRFTGVNPSTPQQTWSRLLSYIGHWSAMGFGYWVIEDRSTGLYAGEIGFADFKRNITPSMQNVPELGFALVSHLHGKGYATEAVSAVLQWGDANLPSERTVAIVHRDNAASQRVLEKAGYAVFERTAFGDHPALFLERRAEKR